MLAGALLGGLTALALTAIYYLADQIAALPFVPFDLFDQLARVLPGGIITLFIDWMVMAIRGLHLGPTADVAKIIEQSLAVIMAMIVGTIFGVLLSVLLRRYPWSGARTGAAGSIVLFFLAAAAELAAGNRANPIVAVLWIGATTIGWGAVLGLLVDGTIRRREVPARAPEAALSRRSFLRRAIAGTLALALASFGLGRSLEESRRPTGANQPLSTIPGSVSPPPQIPTVPTRALSIVPGTRPEVTPNERFYRIDIDLTPPILHEGTWVLEMTGLFDRPRRLALRDLAAYPSVTEPRTLSCISNPVGGDLIGNTYWTGLRIADLMKDLGLRPEATALRVESTDGFHEVVTRADLEDSRTLLVYGMNGKTLAVEHGFPLRILIPNRYGMKQPKWITRITAIDRDEDGYWVQRGWSRDARPQIVSVIDVVAKEQEQQGRVPVGGIAWAGDRGIQRVEVQVDGGPWEAATLLTPPLGPLTWVQWRYDWPAAPGRHTFRVRATDRTGALQIERETSPAPDGATGYHSVTTSL